jgi:ribosomal protein S18 acetylase RimI-like enzyme
MAPGQPGGECLGACGSDDVLIHASDIRVRQAEERDLDTLARFEVRIARISFPDDPIDDARVHRARLVRAMERDRQGMFVAEEPDSGRVVGWLWVSLNTNFATGSRYANFRSLAVAPGVEGRLVAETLFQHGIGYACGQGVGEVVGKVHVSNVPMRLVYRAFGFEPQHLTMKRTLAE